MMKIWEVGCFGFKKLVRKLADGLTYFQFTDGSDKTNNGKNLKFSSTLTQCNNCIVCFYIVRLYEYRTLKFQIAVDR